MYRDELAVDIGLIDAVLLRDDHVGNLLPFDTQRIERVVLSRAEPDAIGMSPIGGLLAEVSAADDWGLDVRLERAQASGGFRVPVSPGLFAPVTVRAHDKVAFDVPVTFKGPGVVALDGDRDLKLGLGEHVTLRLRRDGPWALDAKRIMRWAVAQGMMRHLLS